MHPRELALHARLSARVSAPRLQMTVMVVITAAAGLLASALLNAAGMTSMWLRYPLCVGIAYLVFLAQIWLWRRLREADLSGGPAPGDGGSSQQDNHCASDWSGAGGNSGGAGASARFEVPSATDVTGTRFSPQFDAQLADVSVSDAGVDAEHVWLLPVAILAGLLLAVIWVVWSSPVLLSELALDAVLSTGLYRRLRRTTSDDWLYTTLRHTGWPFLMAVLCSAALGAALHTIAPGSTSLGDAFAAKQGHVASDEQAPREEP